MRLSFKILPIMIIVMGGAFMTIDRGHCEGSKYAQYSSQDAELNVTMDYVDGWTYSETRGSHGSYAQVQFVGEAVGEFSPTFIVTVVPAAKAAFEPLTADGMADDLVGKRMLFEDAQVVSRSATQLFGLPAVDLTLSYKQPENLHSLEYNLIAFKERVVIVQHGDKFYTVSYINPEQVFADFEGDFLHCLGTLSLKE